MTSLLVAMLFVTATHSVEGTLMSVDASASRLMANVDRQFQTFEIAPRARFERESQFESKRRTTARVPMSDLTPGELVRLDLDRSGRVVRVHAIARVERTSVRSASGNTIVLADGREFTASSVLRFAGAPLRPGDAVLVFHHPQSGNVYRVAATGRAASHHSQPPM